MKNLFEKGLFTHKNENTKQNIHSIKDFNIEKSQKSKIYVVVCSIILIGVVVVLFSINRPQAEIIVHDAINSESPEFDITKSPSNGQPIKDTVGLYEEYDQNEVVYLYLTLYQGEDGKGAVWAFDDVNRNSMKVDSEPWVEVLIQQGDENGILANTFGSNQALPQGRLRQRGNSARLSAQKSYKINFYDGIEPWRGQKTLNLNKHFKDETRIKQKFVYDMVPVVGNMVGQRTTFVRLMIKDATAGNEEFVDYGLFTHVEQPNKAFLRSRGLDENGHLYKALMMEFQMSEAFLDEYDGSQEAIQKLETLLEVEVGNNDHRKVLEMLEAVNDYDRDFEEVLSQYFNEDNLYTWLAFNILINNVDATSQNYMLYNSSNSTTWYILPWDNDKTFYTDHLSELGRDNIRHYGLARFWNMVVFQRLVSNPERLQKLNNKIDEINLLYQREETENILEDYAALATQQLSSMPDIAGLNGEITDLYDNIKYLNDLVAINRDRYYEGLESPMPFFLGDPLIRDDNIRFNWSNSEDLQGDTVKYVLQVSTDNAFENIVVKRDVGINTDVSIDKLPDGVYYFKVTAYDTYNNTQNSFDRYYDENRVTKYGMKVFLVN